MRPIGTAQQLAARRERVLRLLQRGHTPAELAEVIGVTLRSIQRWQREAHHPRAKRLHRHRSACRPCRLTAQQTERLKKTLLKSARVCGYPAEYWTLARIADVILKLFKVRYTPSGVWHLLRRMRWSCQKPQRVACQHDDQAIAHWKRYVWPRIKKKWRDLRATLIFIDENGQSLVCPLKRTWAPRGQTPKIRTRIEHNQHVNTIGALLVTPGERKIRLRAKSYRCNLTGEQVIDFLQHLLRHVAGPIVLVWDKAPIHQRKKVQAFLAQHPRIHVYNFPTSAPELNPVEFVWTQIEEYLASRAPQDIQQLVTLVQAALGRTRRSQARLWSCVYTSDLPWKRRVVRH